MFLMLIYMLGVVPSLGGLWEPILHLDEETMSQEGTDEVGLS